MGEYRYVPTPNRAVHEKFLVIYDTRDDYLFINFDVSAIADAPDNHVLLMKSNITLMHNFILPNIIPSLQKSLLLHRQMLLRVQAAMSLQSIAEAAKEGDQSANGSADQTAGSGRHTGSQTEETQREKSTLTHETHYP